MNDRRLPRIETLSLIGSTTQSGFYQGRDDILINLVQIPTFDDEIKRLKEIIGFENETEIKGFLYHNQTIIDFILSAVTQLRKFFSKEKLVLKFDMDPESEENAGFLLLKILSEASSNDTMERVDRFNREWWFRKKISTSGRLIIKEEFV